MDYIKITLKPGKEDSFHRFHPWVFSGAIYRFEKQPEEGDIVEVTDHQGNFIGIGQYQIGSIAVRILTFKPEEINEQFYFKRLQEAYNVRLSLGLLNGEYNNTCRLVHGEGDNLPGLIIDLYNKTAVMQAHTPGMHYARHQIAQALKSVLGNAIDNIYYKSETTLPYKAERTEILCRLGSWAKDRVLRRPTGKPGLARTLRSRTIGFKHVLLYRRFLFLRHAG